MRWPQTKRHPNFLYAAECSLTFTFGQAPLADLDDTDAHKTHLAAFFEFVLAQFYTEMGLECWASCGSHLPGYAIASHLVDISQAPLLQEM